MKHNFYASQNTLCHNYRLLF